jgi:hypothetical protein
MLHLRNLVRSAGRITLALPILAMVGIFCLSQIPGNQLPAWNVSGMSVGNLLHFPVYFALATTWILALESRGVPRRKACWLAVVFAATFGALDEVHQHFVPLRSMDPWDAVVNLAGATCAALCWEWFRPLFFAPATPRDDNAVPPGPAAN